MKQPKFTPGPWTGTLNFEHDGIWSTIVDVNSNAIKGSGRFDICTEEGKANARLIASAPELLEALQKLLPLVARGLQEGAYDNIAAGPGYAERVLAAAESLLAKATGGFNE